MARVSRNLIVLSDGTGNSASKVFKTNVWRLYQALNLRDGKQVAVFGDGVGTSSVTLLRMIGLALGVGVKRNVLNLYKFLCHNYWRETQKDGRTECDRIWMFGFSRGAYTIRVLAGLVHSEGLVEFETEAELERNALAAYRAFRKKAFPVKAGWVFWVPLGRSLRDLLVSLWQVVSGAVPYQHVSRRENIEIHFMGVWDTVAAYGLPIDELTIAFDKWVWPMKFEDTSLLERVRHARHALALDDERRTFHPIPWDERQEKKRYGRVDPDRLTQVWFPGMHADVGGGYPDDGLSFVPLCWMIHEAEKRGLLFEKPIVDTYQSLASPTGRLYDSRGGIGVLWRYQPRNVQLLMDKNDDSVPKEERVTPLVHHCVVTRMTYGNDGYAPKSLPFKINILLPNDTRVPFDEAAVNTALQTVSDAPTRTVLTDLKALVETAEAEENRGNYFALVLDTIWWRRCVYFVTLALALVALAFPLIYALLDWGDKTEKINQITGGTVTYLLKLFKGFIPSFASPWVDAITRTPQPAVNIILLFIISLVASRFLQRRIQDRARAAWNVQPKVGDKEIDRLRLAGQRHALTAASVVLAIVAYFSYGNWKSFLAAVFGVVLSALFAFVRRKKPKRVDPAHPPAALWVARKLRNSKPAVAGYRWFAQTGFPALFILILAWLAGSGLNLGLYNLRNTNGAFCEADNFEHPTAEGRKREARQEAANDKLGYATIDISSPCARTHLWLVAGRQYRIRIEPGVVETAPGTFEKKPEYAWFDKGIPADVTGVSAHSGAHLAAITLKHWWRENYFQPIARVGNIGNYEYPLKPAAPLPKVDFSACKNITQSASPADIESPAPVSARLKEMACETNEGIRRNDVLIADITPDSTGELYIYVNDAILFWDRRDHHKFYKNNSGKAKITVTRTVAPATIDFNSDDDS
ncbi:MAG TPA: DUF2235 domain-containing protein [Candidatus Binatia bacterium]